MSLNNEGPLTPPPRSRGFSFKSDKSGGSKPKEDLVESPREKQRRDSIWKQTSKANPNAAMTEAQPGDKALLEESTLAPLRGFQHKDAYGNVITDPDLSNPTRPRLERPLDTIRSFEKAIDNGYKRRSSYNRSESYGQDQQQYGGSRRNSTFGGYDGQQPPNRQPNGGGYYGGQRPESYYGSGPNGGPRRFGPPGPGRLPSEPMMYNGQRPYPHAHQHSQDTMNTGMTNGSDSTGPWNSHTDPSSENSSIERGPSAPRQYPEYPHSGGPNGYGANGYGPGSIPEDGAYPMRGGAPPVQPPNGARRPIPLGNSDSSPSMPVGNLPSSKRPEPEKRKSWLKRAFSKKE